MASERRHASQLIIFLPLAGFLSGLLTVGLGNSFGKLGIYGIGSVFGAMMGIALAITKMLRGAWKATLLIVPAATAYVVSVLAAALVGMLNNFGNSPASRGTANPPIALFAGGLVGEEVPPAGCGLRSRPLSCLGFADHCTEISVLVSDSGDSRCNRLGARFHLSA